MSFASPPSPPTDKGAASASPTGRRLHAEWCTLQRLAAGNPGRLTGLAADDLTFSLTLRQTPALPLPRGADGCQGATPTTHSLRIVYPEFFPAGPMELYLEQAVYHPNVHPGTGFVCLWDRHRVSNTVEHALHKLVAILGWRLYNTRAEHIMQPEALAQLQQSGTAIAATLQAPPLRGLVSQPLTAMPDTSATAVTLRRPRLS